jgi:hypothetical protein
MAYLGLAGRGGGPEVLGGTGGGERGEAEGGAGAEEGRGGGRPWGAGRLSSSSSILGFGSITFLFGELGIVSGRFGTCGMLMT